MGALHPDIRLQLEPQCPNTMQNADRRTHLGGIRLPNNLLCLRLVVPVPPQRPPDHRARKLHLRSQVTRKSVQTTHSNTRQETNTQEQAQEERFNQGPQMSTERQCIASFTPERPAIYSGGEQDVALGRREECSCFRTVGSGLVVLTLFRLRARGNIIKSRRLTQKHK